MKKKNLKNILTSTFIKFGLIPIIVISSIFISLYYNSSKFLIENNSKIMIEHVLREANEILQNNINLIENKFLDISRNILLIQNEHQLLFQEQNITLPNNIKFDFAPNKVFYQTTKDDTSLYYSSTTKIGDKERKKALLSYKMGTTFKSIVDNNPMIVAGYFNSWDNMNRYYPYIDEVFKLFGSSIEMKNHEFYYLADKKHNPSKNYVWTDTYLDPAGKGWMLSCIVPIYNNGFLEGVSGLDITIDKIIKHILNKKLLFNSKIILLDKKGKALAIPNNMKKLFKKCTDNILHYKDDIIRMTIDNQKYIIIKKVIPITQWNILIFIPRENVLHDIKEVQAKTNKAIYLIVVILFILLIIYSYIVYLNFKKENLNITIPIKKLTQQTILVGDGYEFIKIKESGIYEIDQLYHNFELMVNTLQSHKDKLTKINNTLEYRIEEQVRDALLKDKQIQKYSKHAQMGEMIGMIAHQWRQPLSAISSTSANISLRITLDTLDKDMLQVNINRIIEQCQQMSDTINTFMNFVKPSDKKREFKLVHSINNIIEIMGIQLIAHNIHIDRENIDEDITLIGYEDLLEQVIINLLANARDAFDELDINNKKIVISVKLKDNIPVIYIEDNAGGIDDKVKEKIFNPYFTTKEEGKGTGLGLYMSMDIMRKSFNGYISHKNIENGSIFSIVCGSLP